MQFITFAVTLFTTSVLSAPAPGSGVAERQTYTPCSGLYDTAQCCAVDVLGVADLNCADPPTVPTDATDFQAICADIGDEARCCVLPLLDQGILCETPAGVTD
jgi:hypothetical protein